MNINILEFLLENNSIRIHHNETIRDLEADESHVLGGELVVYEVTGKEVYRGTDLESALKVLNGEEA